MLPLDEPARDHDPQTPYLLPPRRRGRLGGRRPGEGAFLPVWGLPALPGTEVALESGSHDVTCFGQVFKAGEGLTPSEYGRQGAWSHPLPFTPAPGAVFPLTASLRDVSSAPPPASWPSWRL